MQYKYMQVQTVHKFYSGAMMIVQYTLIVWEHDMGLIGKKKVFTVLYSGQCILLLMSYSLNKDNT